MSEAPATSDHIAGVIAFLESTLRTNSRDLTDWQYDVGAAVAALQAAHTRMLGPLGLTADEWAQHACERTAERNLAEQALTSVPAGFVLVRAEPTPEMIAAAALAAWPTASASDIELARKAARIVLEQGALQPGFTLESLACAIATMAPAYRAMIAAAQEAKP